MLRHAVVHFVHVLTSSLVLGVGILVFATSSAYAGSGGGLTYYTLSKCSPSGGTITFSPAGPTYVSGTSVTVKATPAEGYVFTGWSSGGLAGSPSTTTTTVTSNRTICATFATAASQGIPTYSIHLCQPTGNLEHGHITKDPNYGIYVLGTQVDVQAFADLDYVFVGWTGDLSGLLNPRTLAMTQDYYICADIRPSPAIVLYGSSPLQLECGDSYIEPGIIALDDLDGNITSQVDYSNNLDTSTPGSYSVVYDVEDSDENTAHEVRTVTVVDTTPPVLTLLGEAPLTHDFATEYLDAGAEADDHCEGDLTSSIIVGGDEVDPFVPGDYVVIYDVTDASDNHSQETRAVTVTGLAEDLDYACTYFRGTGNTDCSTYDANGKEEGTPSGTFVNTENGIPDRVEFSLLDAIFADTAYARRQEILDAWLNNLAEIDLYLDAVATQHPSAPLPDYRTRKTLAAYTLLGEESHFLANTKLQAKLGVSIPLETTNFEFPTGLAYDEDFDGDGYSNLQEWEYAGLYAAAPEEVVGEYIAAALDSSNVIFPDAVLNELVRTTIGISHGFLYESDLVGATPAFDTLIDLNTDDQPPRIADLTGLDRCADLVSVRLPRQDITDLAPLHPLVNLEVLELSINDISDISPLEGLPNLRDLRMGLNPLSDLSPLSELVTLEWLGLPQTQVTDISPLSGLPNLAFLNLDNLTLADLSDLAPLLGLETLRLSNTNTTRLTAIDPLAATGALTQLYINACPLANEALCDDIPYFESNGVTVNDDDNVCQRFLTVTHTTGGIVKVNGTEYTTGPLSIDLNAITQLTAVPNGGYALKTWEGALSVTTNPANLTLANDASVHAVFEQVYKLNATIKDSANAEVVITPASPPNAPGNHYFSGQVVTLTATEDSTWDFIRWEDGSGSTLSTSLTYQVTMNSAKDIVAVFDTYALTVQAENTSVSVHMGETELTAGQEGEWGLPDGAEITISAAPVSGHKFAYWENANGEILQLNPSLTLDGNAASSVELSAHSVSNSKAELVVVTPAAWQSALDTEAAPLTVTETQFTNSANESKGKSKLQFNDAGDVVLSLDPQVAGETLVWKSLTGVIVGTGPSYTCRRAKGESKVLFVETADENADYFGVYFGAVGNGVAYIDNIAVRPEETLIVDFDRYDDGIPLSAKADTGWSFVGWKDSLANDIASTPGIETAIAHENLDIDGDGKVLESDLTIVRNVLGGASSGAYNTDVDGDNDTDEEDLQQVGSALKIHTVVAMFEAVQQYTLNATASPTAGGTIVKPQTEFAPGTLAVIEAIPNEGYYFSGWTGTETSDSQALVHEMTSNVSLTAHFHVEDRPVITLFGADYVELQPDEYFYDPGAFAEDINGNDIRDRIRVSTIEGKPGVGWTEYRYSVRDTAGRSAVPVSRFVMALGLGVNKSLNTHDLDAVCTECLDSHEDYVQCYVLEVGDRYECIPRNRWSNTPDSTKPDPSDRNVKRCSELICNAAPSEGPGNQTVKINIVPEHGGGEYAVTDSSGWLWYGGIIPLRWVVFPSMGPWLDENRTFIEDTPEEPPLRARARVKSGHEDTTVFDYWEVNGRYAGNGRVSLPLRPTGSEATAYFRDKEDPSGADPDTIVSSHVGITALVEPGYEEFADIALYYADDETNCVGKEGIFFNDDDDYCWSDYQEATATRLNSSGQPRYRRVIPKVEVTSNDYQFLGWQIKRNNSDSWECQGPLDGIGLCDPGTTTLGAVTIPTDSVDVYMARFARKTPQNPPCAFIDVNADVASNPPASTGKTADSEYIPTDETECRFEFTATEADFFRWTIEIDIPSNEEAERKVLDSIDVGSSVFEVSLPVGTASFTATAHYHVGPWGDTSSPNDEEDNPQFVTDSVCEESDYGTVKKEVFTTNDGSQTATFTAESDGKATFKGWEITNDLGVESDLTGVDLSGTTLTINTRDINGEQGKHIRYTVTATYENCVPPECASVDAEPEVEGCGTADVIYTSENGACKLTYKAEALEGAPNWIGWDTDSDLSTIEEESVEFTRIGAPSIAPTAIFAKCDEIQDSEQESVTDECPVVEETSGTQSDPEEADPIYWYSGELYEVATDIEVEGKGIGLSWTRKYRSRIAKEHVLGNNWDHSYNIYLTRSTTLGNNDLVLHRGLHRIERFKDTGNGTWNYGERVDSLSKVGAEFKLVASGPMTYWFKDFTATTAPGKLVRIEDRYGNEAHLAYLSNGRLSTVTDTQGNVLTVTYHTSGRIDTVEVNYGGTLLKKVRYEYYGSTGTDGSQGDLKLVKTFDVVNTSQALTLAEYTYYLGSAEKPALKHNLRKIIRERQNGQKEVVAENAYGDSGYAYDRVVTQKWGSEGNINLHYQNNTNTNWPSATTITVLNDRKGNITEFYYDNSHRLVAEVVHDNKNGDPAQSPSPDPDSITTPKTNRWTPGGFTTTYTWNTFGRLTQIKYPSGRIKEYVYDSGNSNPQAKLNVREVLLKSSATDTNPIKSTTQYEDCNCGQLDFVLDPKGNRTEYTYQDVFSGENYSHGELSVVPPAPFNNTDHQQWVITDAWGRTTSVYYPKNGSGRRQDDYLYEDSVITGYSDTIGPIQFMSGTLNVGATFEESAWVLGGGELGIIRPLVSVARDRLGRLVGIDISKEDWQAATFTPGVDRGTRIVYDGYGRVSRIIQSIGGGSAIYTEEVITYFSDGLPKNRTITEYGHTTDIVVQPYYAEYIYDELGMLTLKKEKRDTSNYFVETHYAYDANKNLKEVRAGAVDSTDNDHIETYVYNSRNLLGRKFVGGKDNPNAVEVNYRYDTDGRLTLVESGGDGSPKETVYGYDGYGRLDKVTLPENVMRRFWYDRNGNVTDEIAVGRETEATALKLLAYTKYEYDQLDRVTLKRTLKENDARDYTDSTAPPSLISPIWFDQSYVYTPNSQIKEVSSSSGYEEKLTYTYDGMNRVKSVTDEKGNKNTYSYDGRSHLTEILEDAISDDPNGTDRQFNTTILRDFLGRSYQVANSANETTLFERDRYGNVLRKIEPGQTSGTGSIQEFDALGRLVHAKSTLPGTSDEYINTYHSWDDSSRKKSSTDPAGIATTYVYNALSQLEFVRLPYHGETGFQRKHTYNKYGELENVQDSNGTTFVLGYDNLGRLVSRTATPGSSDIVNSGNESFAYDGLSRVINATKGEGASVVTRKYDTLSNLREESVGGNTTKFEWDGLGNLAKMTYPGDREASYAYDTGARLNTITDATFTTGITYDYLGGSRTESIGLSTGLSVKVAYDTASRVSGIDYKAGNTTLYNMDFDWTPRGNLDLVESVVGNRTTQYDWSYDNAERLTALDFDLDTGSGDNEKETSFLLFPSGAHKRVTRNGAGFSADNAVSGSAAFPQVYENYVEDVPGSTDTTWHEVVDANGNRTNFYPGSSTNGGHTYTYDQDNRLVSYSDLNDVVTTYAYDAFGRRISKTTGSNTTRYVYAGWDAIQERNGANELLRSFLLSGQATDGVVAMTTHDPATGAATASYFYLKDARGNVVALATPAGSVVERYVYDAYGTPTVYNASWGSPTSQSPLGNPYLFQSRNYDSESGLYYYRLRYMDPFVGRFITPDPIGNWGDAANLGNPYTYVGNNPWTYSDPLGLEQGPFSPEWHHLFPREIFGDIFSDINEAWNGFWLPHIFHNSEGTGLHNTMKGFGLDWNKEWQAQINMRGSGWRSDGQWMEETLEAMKKIPRFAPAFAVGEPATVPFLPFDERGIRGNEWFRNEATTCAPKMYDKAKALGMLEKRGILKAIKAAGKRGAAALGLGLFIGLSADVSEYGAEEAAKRNTPGIELYYLSKDGAWWFCDRVASGRLIPGYTGEISDNWISGGEPLKRYIPEIGTAPNTNLHGWGN